MINEILLEYRWYILLLSEIMAWLLVIPVLYFRYWNRSALLFIFSSFLEVSFDYILPLYITALVMVESEKNIWDLPFETKALVGTTIFFLFFGIVFGKKIVWKIDQYLYGKVQELKKKREAVEHRPSKNSV